MLPGWCCITNRHIGARERRQLIPHVRFQVPFLGPESQLKSGFACAGLLCKGKSARFQWVSVPMSQAQDPKPGEKVRKLRRTLARCEVLRLVQLGRRPNGSLLRRVFGHLGETWTENQIADRARGILSRVQTDLLQGQQQDKTARLASWKKRLNDPTLKGLGRWIRTKESGKPGVIVVDDTGPITHRTEVTAAICSFWQKVWQEPSVPVSQSVNQLVADFTSEGPDPRAFSWQPLGYQDLWRSVRDASGSGGPDKRCDTSHWRPLRSFFN